MSVQQILEHKGGAVFAVRPEASVAKVVALLVAERIGTVLVTDSAGRLIGIISERDIARALGKHGVRFFDLSAEAMMVSPVVTCAPETGIEDVLALMQSHGIRHLPVARGQEILGMISIRDVLNYRTRSLEANIAAARTAEQETNRAREAAERANRAKSEFFANMSHELMTPLNAVIGFSQLMAGEPLGPIGVPQYRAYVNDIEDAGRRLMAIVGDLLDMSRIEIGDLQPIPDPVSIADSVASSVHIVEERAKRAGVALSTAPLDGLPSLFADERMLGRMLGNLLGNAIKFTPAGGAVTIRGACDELGAIRLSVIDTGIGIASDALAKLAQPFQQVDGSSTRRFEGTGLGLALTDRMVALHGGTLVLASEVGVGTTATLCFPPQRTLIQPAHSAAAATG